MTASKAAGTVEKDLESEEEATEDEQGEDEMPTFSRLDAADLDEADDEPEAVKEVPFNGESQC